MTTIDSYRSLVELSISSCWVDVSFCEPISILACIGTSICIVESLTLPKYAVSRSYSLDLFLFLCRVGDSRQTFLSAMSRSM